MNTLSKTIIFAVASMLTATNITAQNRYLVYKDGNIIFAGKKELIDSVRIEENRTKINFYANNTSVYMANLSQVDSVTFLSKPTADLLDIVFKADGTAEDIAPLKLPVVKEGNSSTTYYNDTYKRYVAKFNNPYGGACSGYYRIDYRDNIKFKSGLMDGHTLEAVFMTNYTGTIPDKESKPFASHEAGGTGFVVTPNAKGNEITFLPNVTANNNSNWMWTQSGIRPESTTTYYHVVGVWNKEEQKTYVYVNGALQGTLNTNGKFRFPVAGGHWFCIGGDAGPTAGQFGWTGDVVLARIYDAPLNQAEVLMLWHEVNGQ